MSDSEQQRIAAVYAGGQRQQRASMYAWYRPEVQWTIYRMRAVLARHLADTRWRDLSTADICDIGCGHGSWLRFLLDSGAAPERLHGIDLIPERVACARAGLPAAVSISEGNATALPYPDARFDLVSANTVFSSILDSGIRLAVAREMWRVLRPGGFVYILDFRISDPRNPNTIGIRTGELRRLFPQGRQTRRSVLLLPPIARRLAPWCMPAVAALEWLLPFLRGHVATAICKDA